MEAQLAPRGRKEVQRVVNSEEIGKVFGLDQLVGGNEVLLSLRKITENELLLSL